MQLQQQLIAYRPLNFKQKVLLIKDKHSKCGTMKILLEVDDTSLVEFRSAINRMKFAKILHELRGKDKEKQALGLISSFKDIELHEQGKKRLKTAEELLDEL
jgi:hypothetical protein